jgi:hypothetical protein
VVEELDAAHRHRQTGHNNPYRPDMGFFLRTDVDGMENEHAIGGGTEGKGNCKI